MCPSLSTVTAGRLLATLAAFLAVFARAQTPPTDLQLFLLMGQSNMAGRGDITEKDTITHPRIWMLTQNNTWVLARDPVHYDRSYAGVGLASQFARDLAAAEPNTNIGLIPTAVGGSVINEWAPGTTYYNNAIARTRAALTHGALAGILWHQGESDATSSGASTYLNKFANLIGQLRAELNAHHIPVVAGELGRFRTANESLNPTLFQIPDRIPRAGFATSEGLTHKGDSLHFNTPSLYEFGHRYILQWATVDSWHNFEAEQLARHISGGTSMVLAALQASSGFFVQFQPSAFGQYLELTLPNVSSGTYVVKFRFHRHAERGRCRVSIDGVQLGGELDQTGSTNGSSQHTLGTVTFANTGNHVVRITSTSSSGASKVLSADAIVLEPQPLTPPPSLPIKLEPESVPVVLSGGSTLAYNERAASGGRWLKFFPTAFGQSISFTLNNVPAGSYDVKFLYKRDPDRGRGTVWLDGTQLGGEIDHYGANAEFVQATLGSVTWTGTGSHVVRVVSSSSRGTSKNLAIDAFVLVPRSPSTTTTFEADVLPTSLSGGSTIAYNERAASGGRWLKFFPTAFGQSINFTLNNVPAGSYDVKFLYKRDPDRGRGTVWLDGTQLGGEIDHYGATAEFVQTTLGTVTWSGTGSHVVRVVSSSSSGTSKNLAIDAFVLVRK